MNRTVITWAHIRGAAAIAGLAVGVSLILAGLTLALRGHAHHDVHTPDLYTHPQIEDAPGGQKSPWPALGGSCFVIGAGIAGDALLFDLDQPATVAYAAVVVVAAAAAGAVLYHHTPRGGA